MRVPTGHRAGRGVIPQYLQLLAVTVLIMLMNELVTIGNANEVTYS